VDDARDRVRRLAALVESGRPLPPDLAAWLADGLSAWLAAGGRRSLDASLGIVGRGVRSLATHDATRRRDAALMSAFEFAHDGQHRDARWRARALSAAIEKFERRTWPRVRDADEPPARLSRLERELFRARRLAGRPLPTTPGHLLARAYGRPGRK